MSLFQKAVICLRGIDTEELAQKYERGEFSSLREIEPMKETLKIRKLVVEQTTSRDAAVYTFRDRNNCIHRVWTTNRVPTDECWWCRKSMKDRTPVGVPYAVNELNGMYIFYVDQPNYCSFECAFSGMKYFPNQRLVPSEYLLRFMYFLITGSRELREAPDWRLMREYSDQARSKTFKPMGYYVAHEEFIELK